MGSSNQTLEKCRRFVKVITDMGMVEIPVQRLSEEEQAILRQEAEIERMRQRRLRESQTDQMWPRRKRSDLMAHMMPATRQSRPVPKEAPAPSPVQVPIKKKSASQDNMWPRRKKSDLYIYQLTRSA